MLTQPARVYRLEALLGDQRRSGEPWFEFLRTPSLRTGLYVLDAGAWDSQTPHEEDEVYHVVRGRAMFQAGEKRWPVEASSIIFVPARQEHRFTDIVEPLTVLVFFAKPREMP